MQISTKSTLSHNYTTKQVQAPQSDLFKILHDDLNIMIVHFLESKAHGRIAVTSKNSKKLIDEARRQQTSLRIYHYQPMQHAIQIYVPKKLKILDLTLTKVDDEGLLFIAQSCPRLEGLNLTLCRNFTNKGLKHLQTLPLSHLNLSHDSQIEDEGIRYLIPLKSLVYLNTKLCWLITSKMDDYLQKFRK